MTVDFNRIKSFKMNFDKCSSYHQVGEIIKEIEGSEDPSFLAILKTACKYYNEFRVAAVYEDYSMHVCDMDDLRVLIETFPGGGK